MNDIEFEQVIIKTLYANGEVSGKIIPELQEDWFINVDHKIIAKSIIDYNTQYSAIPNVIEMHRMLTDERTITAFDKCMGISDEEVNTSYILDEIQTFVRKRLLRQVSMEIGNYCAGGKSNLSFADESAYAETFTFDTQIGFSFFEEPERIFENIITNEKLIPTGCKSLDEMIGGGFHEKSLNLIMAPTNIGKTLIMCSMASAMVLAGYKVLYVTFEDSELKIGQRIMQNIFDITQDELRSLSGKAYRAMWEKATKQIGNNKLVIKEYSEGSVSALTLKALIKDLKDKRGFVPDVLFIDYIRCMIPNGRVNPNMNDNSKLLEISSQVRSIGMEMGIPTISGMQSNRGGYGKSEIGLDDAADSFGQTMKADAIFGVTQTPELKSANMYNVKLLKTRYGGNFRGATVTIGVNIEKQKIYDLRTNSKVSSNSSWDDTPYPQSGYEPVYDQGNDFVPVANQIEVPQEQAMQVPDTTNDINLFD